MGWYGDYPRRPRKQVTGGIKAQTVQGKSWWGKRWQEALDSFGLGSRLARGRTYARQGQVISVDMISGSVSAKVQGSRSTPYKVTINVKTLDASQWKLVKEEIRKQPIFAAKLLSGEMPEDIESVFLKVGVSLFPKNEKDFTTDCSCPDWSNPCKHTAAVYIILGGEFDRDPFLIFQLRGMERDELVSGLEDKTVEPDIALTPPEPLATDIDVYWNGTPFQNSKESLYGDVRKPPVSASLLTSLGPFPFWRGEEPVAQVLEPNYGKASSRSLEAFLGTEAEDKKLGLD